MQAALLTLDIATGAPAGAQEPALVERVEIAGNRYLPKETLLFYVSTKPGERYAEKRLAEDFRRLWSTSLLEDVRLEVSEGVSGKVVVFHVIERKRLQAVEYRGSKKLTPAAIEEELRRRDLAFRPDTMLDPARPRRVEAVIRELLARKGHPFAEVSSATKDADTGQRVVFSIEDGPRARLNEIVFPGAHAFSESRLRGELKRLKPTGFFNLSWLGDRGVWSPEAWSGGVADPPSDRERIRRLYLKHGYVDVRLGEPKLTSFDLGSPPTRWVRVEVPVEEGEQYRMGTLAFLGLTQFRDDELRRLFALSSGRLYDESKIRAGIEALRELYGRRGFFQANVAVRPKPDPRTRLVDLVLSVDEDKRYFVGRIRFTGNGITRDKLLRRAVFLNEGDVFDTEALKNSIRRIDQLGYFRPMERPRSSPPARRRATRST